MSTKALDPVTDTVGDATETATSVVGGLTGGDGGKGSKKTPKKLSSSLQKTASPQTNQLDPASADDDDDSLGQQPEPTVMPKRSGGRRMVPLHQSRIADRPLKVGEKDSSLKIKIELDLEVEVEIYARVKGDVTIGLM